MRDHVYTCTVSKVLTSLPVGERVGIAFSGGLDTSVAVAWMREKGAVPAPTPPTSASTTSPTSTRSPAAPASTAPRSRAWSTARTALVEEGLSAIACGAFHIRSGGKTYFNTTPLGRVVTGTLLVRAMNDDGVDIWGDGSTYKGNDIERFYRYGLLANPAPAHLQALARRRLRHRARRPPRDVRVADRPRPALPRLAPRRPTPPTPTSGAPPTRRRRSSSSTSRMEIVEPIMGVTLLGPVRRDRDRGRHGPLRAGPPGRHQRRRVRRRRSPWSTRPTRSAAATAWACATRSRTASSRPSAAASTRRPAMALLHITYERLLNAIHNEDTIANYHAEGRRLGRLLYEGRWLDPQSLMLRESIQRWVASAVTGEVTVRLRRGDDYSIVNTTGPAFSYHPEKLSMERTEDAAFGPVDRIGQLTMRNLDIADSRAKLELYAAQGLLGRRARSSSASSTPGGAAAISANPAAADVDARTTRSTAPRWSSAPTDLPTPPPLRADRCRGGIGPPRSLFWLSAAEERGACGHADVGLVGEEAVDPGLEVGAPARRWLARRRWGRPRHGSRRAGTCSPPGTCRGARCSPAACASRTRLVGVPSVPSSVARDDERLVGPDARRRRGHARRLAGWLRSA